MGKEQDILNYNDELESTVRELAQAFCTQIAATIPQAQGKVWHGHPVWFIDENPVAGYSLKKSGLEVLFWSGQSFRAPGLTPNGKFKAAALPVSDLANLDVARLVSWLRESIDIQWDYGNLFKNRELVKLTVFNE